MSAWASDTLRSVLSSFSHSMNDATLSISEIDSMEGESSVSIRKGKKIVSYDYNIKLKWQCVLKDNDGVQVSKVEGKYELPEVSCDEDVNDWEVRVEYGEDPDNLRQCLDQLVRSFAPKALRMKIKT